MNSPADRERLRHRRYELEAQIADIHDDKTVAGDPAEQEGKLLTEQDEIDYRLGIDEFDDDRQV